MSTILKWAGNKSAVMPELARYLPHGSRLVEPFAGSCAVMMATDYPQYLIADINPDLINLYQVIKSDVEYFIKEARCLFKARNAPEAYYKTRLEFNLDHSCRIKRALYFLYLNRHGYRGLCRYNQKGQFNVPYGNYKKPYFPEREILSFAEKSKRATFLCAGYQDTLKQLKSGDVVYCDPPYDDTFASYHSNGFNKEDQKVLAETLFWSASEFPVIASNSDTYFIRYIYKGFGVHELITKRSIGISSGESKQGHEVILSLPPLSSFWAYYYALASDRSIVSQVPQ